MSDPTRPISHKPAELSHALARRAGRGSAGSAATTQAESSSQPPAASLDPNVGEARALMDAARAEVHQVDAARLAELRAMVAEGRYRVDVSDLADRMLSDARPSAD